MCFFRKCISRSQVPFILKQAGVTPVLKREFTISKVNYRPVSFSVIPILAVISGIFEKFIFTQITLFVDKFFSKYHCAFRKGFSAQDYLLNMLENFKSTVDNGKVFRALLTNLSERFDCVSHRLIIAKLKLMVLPCLLLTYEQLHYKLDTKKQLTTHLALGKT